MTVEQRKERDEWRKDVARLAEKYIKKFGAGKRLDKKENVC